TALPVAMRALVPPTAYDALMYHLPAPKLFLDAHTLLPFLENVQANSPIAFDLLTAFGLSVGSEVFPQLLQFALGLVLALGVYQVAMRAFNRSVGILAAAILFSIPVFGILAGWAYLDVVWGLCEFLSVYAFWNWVERRQTQWLILSATLMGLALSNKYLALQGMIVLAIAVVIASRPDGWLRAARNLIVFGFFAGLAAFPWYFKNWIWLGNPVYPYFLGGVNYDALRLQFNTYLGSGYGVGRDWLAYVMLPLNIFARSGEFGPVALSAPSFCFLILPAYLTLPKPSMNNWLIGVSAARFAIWAAGAQELRFLFVVYPMLSIVSGYVIYQLLERWRKPLLRAEIGILVGLIIGAGAWFQWQYCLKQNNPLAYLAGVASRADFLRANLNPYLATEFVNTALPSAARILAIGDGRGYYFAREFIADTGRDHWHSRITQGRTFAQVLAGLRTEGITHIWVSAEDLTHTYEWLDRQGRVRAEMRAFDDFKDCYLLPVYRDVYGYEIYALPNVHNPIGTPAP
ncbi:MAG: glycosyltransferase family 39 protein, partial [Chloroflexota bacterium]